MLAAYTLLVDDPTPEAEGQPKSEPAPMGFFLLNVGIIAVLFYFLMIRPGRRVEGERKLMLAALKKNQKVVTQGGIIGFVANVNEKEDEVTLRVDEGSNLRLKVLRSAIVRVLTPPTEEPAKEGKENS